ncbi:MAG: hypothetical protein ACJ796_08890 [Gemmatimonadaceae bacterium]
MSAGLTVYAEWGWRVVHLLDSEELHDDEAPWWSAAHEHSLVELFANKLWNPKRWQMIEAHWRQHIELETFADAKRELVRDEVGRSLTLMRAFIPIDERSPNIQHLPVQWLHGGEAPSLCTAGDAIRLPASWRGDIGAMYDDLARFFHIFRRHVLKNLDNRLRRMQKEQDRFAKFDDTSTADGGDEPFDERSPAAAEANASPSEPVAPSGFAIDSADDENDPPRTPWDVERAAIRGAMIAQVKALFAELQRKALTGRTKIERAAAERTLTHLQLVYDGELDALDEADEKVIKRALTELAAA